MLQFYMQNPIYLVFMLIVVICSFTFHEYAHAWAAVKSGDYTPKSYGRLTLNPLKHVDWFGFMLLMFAGFGYAKPVPVQPTNFRNIRRGIFLTSIAGVTANFIFAFLAMPLMYLFYYTWEKGGSSFAFYMLYFFMFLTQVNFMLIVFNLLPIYPLDGFHVVEAFTSHRNKFVQFMLKYGSYILIALILLGVLIDFLADYDIFLPPWLDLMSQYIHYARYIFWPLDKLWCAIFGLPSLLF